MNTSSRHTYEYNVDVQAQTAPAKVVRMVGSDKRVLEIGAGPGSITKMLQNNNCRVTGVEIDSSAIEKLSAFCESVYQCDLNVAGWSSRLAGCGTFDVLVAADVFEHLYKPQDTLLALRPFFSDQGYLVASLPHVGNNAIIASILDGDFEYRDWGLLDRTHIRFFGLKNMQNFFESAGYKILSAEFVVTPPEQTELAPHWIKLSRKLKAALKTSSFGTVYQVVMRVVPVEFAGNGVQLMDLPVPRQATTIKQAAIARLRPYVNPEIRRLLKRVLHK